MKTKMRFSFLMIGLLIISIPTLVLAQNKKVFVSIFDGKTLNGWEGDANYWRVENGCIVGEITPDKLLKANTFLIWRGGESKDFELELEFKISHEGNSGINYRSEQITEVPFALKGYQADIDGMIRYTGQNYEERGRTTLAYRGQTTKINSSDKDSAVQDNVKNNAWTKVEVVKSLGRDSLKNFIKSEEWNEVHLIIKGNRLQHYVNGVLMSDVTDNDKVNRKMAGLIGVQVHVGPPMKVEYRNIMIKQ
ncbi:MAG: DUF1080 domain-containing protein [Flammeovirgaceae bacterium]|nr:DUF1080 domain-containing protein [Flammeovirgaceae bacterium]